MTRAEIDARIEELRPMADEFTYLQMVVHHHDEGFIEIDEEGRMFATGAPEVIEL